MLITTPEPTRGYQLWVNQYLSLYPHHTCIKLVDTVGEVAAARRGSRPPQHAIRLSASWEITWVTLTANTWFSDAFTKSITVFVACLQKVDILYHNHRQLPLATLNKTTLPKCRIAVNIAEYKLTFILSLCPNLSTRITVGNQSPRYMALPIDEYHYDPSIAVRRCLFTLWKTQAWVLLYCCTGKIPQSHYWNPLWTCPLRVSFSNNVSLIQKFSRPVWPRT